MEYTTQLYGEQIASLTNDQTVEQKDEIAERARKGGSQEREAFIVSFLGYVTYWAARYTRAYSWASGCIDYLELVAVGNLAVVASVDEALTKIAPWPYLAKVARHRMLDFCQKYMRDSMLMSLDSSLDDESQATLADILVDTSTETEDTPDFLEYPHEQVHQAVEKLTMKQKYIVTRLYGLHGARVQNSYEVGQDMLGKSVSHQAVIEQRDLALRSLRCYLEHQEETYTFNQLREAIGGGSDGRVYRFIQNHHITPIKKGKYPKPQVDAIIARKGRTSAKQGNYVRGTKEACSLAREQEQAS